MNHSAPPRPKTRSSLAVTERSGGTPNEDDVETAVLRAVDSRFAQVGALDEVTQAFLFELDVEVIKYGSLGGCIDCAGRSCRLFFCFNCVAKDLYRCLGTGSHDLSAIMHSLV
jgi:hypothetical protein